MRVHLSLGSNVEPARHLPEAVIRLRALGRIAAASAVYRSPPQAGARGPDFLNAVVTLETALPLPRLRGELRSIEAALGRERPAARGAPRTIDIDLILAEGREPHPDILLFAHVAVPLAEVQPDFVHPRTGEPIAAVARRLCGVRALERRDDVSL